MDINYYARLYRVRPLELRLCQTSCLCIHGITITLKFFFFLIIARSFLSFLLPMLGMKQKFISNLPVVRVGAFLWYKAKGLCISGALVEIKDVLFNAVYNETINWWVFCKTWVLASAFSLVAINCLASLNLLQTNFYIKNRNLKTCTL